ncbi:TPA: hypothetical protein HA265_07005 [Candidatus Woesearchaeota archaeon]|nr:hypothetical protein [Candidatus Woesearchaeota archaeon]
MTSFKKGMFEIFDPKKGQLLVPEAVFKESFGKVKEVKRDNRMIVFG